MIDNVLDDVAKSWCSPIAFITNTPLSPLGDAEARNRHFLTDTPINDQPTSGTNQLDSTDVAVIPIKSLAWRSLQVLHPLQEGATGLRSMDGEQHECETTRKVTANNRQQGWTRARKDEGEDELREVRTLVGDNDDDKDPLQRGFRPYHYHTRPTKGP